MQCIRIQTMIGLNDRQLCEKLALVETIDLTTQPKKSIQTSTLLVGSSILKGIRTAYLKPNVAVRTFPGATVDSLRTKLGDYDLDKCTTIILPVGGNKASNSTGLCCL